MASQPKQLGRYELLRRIAAGGMGEIWLARTRGAADFEKTCIIKTILSHLSEEHEFVEKFLDEGRLVVKLVHGNIVPVFDLGQEEDTYYLAMEYIPGRDLREVLKRSKSRKKLMPVEMAMQIISDVCKGLYYAHQKTDEDGRSLQIVHRDISPSNVLISSEGEVKIIDFGIARARGRLSKTVSGRIQGKFCYMSPEQASGKSLDARSDIFSTGVVLYELLTGFRPFEGESDMESLDLVRNANFDPPSTLRPEISPELDEIVARALAKDPQERFQSAEEMHLELMQELYGTGKAPSARAIADWIGELFPEGLEREELRASRNSTGPKGLDEILGAELDRMEVSPHETTAFPVSEPGNHTRTVSEPDSSMPSGPTVAALPSRRTDSGPLGAASTAEANGEPPAGTTPTKPPSLLETRPRGLRRSLVIAAIIGAIIGAILVLQFVILEPTEGVVVVQSTPSQAAIMLDGALLLDRMTPTELSLAPGAYNLTLQRAGFENRTIKVEVQKGQTVEVSGEATTLTPLPEDGPRDIEVLARPHDVRLELVRGDSRLPLGTPPATITLRPRDEWKLRASKQGCETLEFDIDYGFPGVRMDLGELHCPPVEPSADNEKEKELAKNLEDQNSKNNQKFRRRASFRVVSDPPQVHVRVNGEDRGKTPVGVQSDPDDDLVIEASLDGFQTKTWTGKASEPRGSLMLILERQQRGCLNVRLVYPNIGEIQVNGRWLEEPRSHLRNFPISVGKATIRVRNQQAGRDDTFEVDVPPGDQCAHLVVWDRDG